MEAQGFEYEVAISFLAKDESIATELYNLLSPRVRTFVYSKRQEEILGTDGMDTFSSVFSTRARLNVVLFREGWGQTKWTRVEETVIKDRVFNDGWDTFCLVRLDKSPQPKWVPRTYLYIDFADKGVQGTRAIVEQKVLEFGGNVTPESLVDFAARFKKDLENIAYLNNYPDTLEAYSDSRKAIQELLSLFESGWGIIKQSDVGISIEGNKKSNDSLQISSEGVFMAVRWNQPVNSSIHNAKLKIRIFKNASFYREHDYENIYEALFSFSLNSVRERGWSDQQNKFWNANDLVDYYLKHFLNIVKKRREY